MQIFAINKGNSFPNKAESTEAQKSVLGFALRTTRPTARRRTP